MSSLTIPGSSTGFDRRRQVLESRGIPVGLRAVF